MTGTTTLHIPTLATERLVLRAARASDWPAYAAYRESRRSPDGPMPRETAWLHFTSFTGHWMARGFGRFILEDRATGDAIGHAGPFLPEGWPENELTWTLWTAEAEGQGFAFEAASAARKYAYDTLGWTTAVSLVAPGNTRSQALARRLGCTADASVAMPWPGAIAFRHPAPEALQ